MRKLPSLNAIKAFEATARLSSITKAGDELGVSHSSISQQIKQLEQYFGQRLFLRKGRGIEPTSPAMAYLDDVRFCLDRLAASSEQLATGGGRRLISVNATPSFVMRWLIPKSADFLIKNPDVKVDISTSYSDGFAHLSDPFDVLFRRDVMAKPDHVCRRILPDVSSPVMKPVGVLPASPEDLVHLKLLHMRSRPDAWRQWFKAHGVSRSEMIAGDFFDHFFLSLQAATEGLGVAMAPQALVEDDLAAGRLVAPLPELTLEGPGFFVLYRKGLANEPAGRRYLRWLAEATDADVV